jgi:MFS transporter, SP family, xylose:H+ symportor
MFFSNTIFSDIGGKNPDGTPKISATAITGLVGFVNFFTTLIGMALLSYAGRKTIMLWCNLAMAIILLSLGYFTLEQHNILSVIMVMLFIAFFEFSSGPITWLYMSEIMQDKAQSFATVLNWLVNLGISAGTVPLLTAIGYYDGGDDNTESHTKIGYVFLGMGIMTTIGTLFIAAFMKETRGKTAQEIEEMFSSNPDYSPMNMNKKIVDDSND